MCAADQTHLKYTRVLFDAYMRLLTGAKVRNYSVLDWKDYYLDNVRRVDAAVTTYADSRRARVIR